MIYSDLHEVGRKAINCMLEVAQKGEGDLTEFHERQLVHALYEVLESRLKVLWAAFEYGYFNETEDRWLRGKADLCTYVKDRYAWFEVKMTGLNPSGWDNSHLGIWEDDVRKLKQVRGFREHQTAWVWLFLFETFRNQMEEIGKPRRWTNRREASEYAPRFGEVKTKVGRLSKTLSEASKFAKKNGTEAVVSFLPLLKLAKINKGCYENDDYYSAMLLTMDFTPR